MKKSIFWLVPAVLAIVLSGCKKNEETTSTPSLSGLSVSSSIPYAPKGATITVKANASSVMGSDGTHPSVGLCWEVNSGKKDTLTTNANVSNPEFKYTLDTLGKYTIKCYAFAGSGYYSTSASTEVRAIDPEKDFSGFEGTNYSTIGGHIYRTITAGGLTWMAQNLYGTAEGVSYMDADVTESFFGKFYTWEEASAACPDGWRLPTAAEWDNCLGSNAGELMANALFLSENLWPRWPQVTITNSLQFNVIPTGYKDKTVGGTTHHGYKEYAFFWTADRSADPSGMAPDLAEYRYFYENSPEVLKGNGSSQSLALSVRCVKD